MLKTINYEKIIDDPAKKVLIMGDKVGEFAGGLINLRYKKLVGDEDEASLEEANQCWEQARKNVFVVVQNRLEWLGTMMTLNWTPKNGGNHHVINLQIFGGLREDNIDDVAWKIRVVTGVDKFDFLIGNPPYQEKTAGNNNKYKPVYPWFMELSYKLADIAELITPARFLFNIGATNKKWNQKMLNDKHLTILKYFENSQEVFSNASVAGGIVVTLRDKNQDFGAIGVFIPDKELKSIYKKVSKKASQYMNGLVSSRGFYKYTSKKQNNSNIIQANAFTKNADLFEKQNKFEINVLGREDGHRAVLSIKKENVKDDKSIGKWKVFIPKAYGTAIYPDQIIGKIEIGKPNEICTETFLKIGDFETKTEAENCKKYLETKFARALISIVKKTQNSTKSSFTCLPVQDFSDQSDIDWNLSIKTIDQELANKYNLNFEEQVWIEQNIKAMD